MSAGRESRLALRPMAEADIDAVAAIRVRGWQHAYAGLMPQSYLDAMNVADDAARRREHFARGGADGPVNLVAEDAHSVVGWAAFGTSREDDAQPGDCELYALYVRVERIGTGVGRALADAALSRAAAQGSRRMLLWVLTDNARARRFYERCGFAPDGSTQAWSVHGACVPEVRYTRTLGGADRLPPGARTSFGRL